MRTFLWDLSAFAVSRHWLWREKEYVIFKNKCMEGGYADEWQKNGR